MYCHTWCRLVYLMYQVRGVKGGVKDKWVVRPGIKYMAPLCWRVVALIGSTEVEGGPL